jgi:hypothetical protein
MLTAAAGPDWATVMTAFGTVGAVIAALFIAFWADSRAGKRLDAERDRSDERLREERERSDAQLAEERQIAQERERFAEAYAVQVIMGDRNAGHQDTGVIGHMSSDLKRVAAIIINHGTYTITGVEAQLRLTAGGNPSLVSFGKSERVSGTAELDKELRGGMYGGLEAALHADRLSPWDRGIRFETGPMPTEHLSGAYPVVRWMDRWGTRWEHRRGEVRQVADGSEPWQP